MIIIISNHGERGTTTFDANKGAFAVDSKRRVNRSRWTNFSYELQYNPAKPHKWGYKNQVLSGISGFSYDFDLLAGHQSNKYPDGAPDLGISSNFVTRLTSTVPKNVQHKIFFDNWYNSPNLQIYLYKNGLLPLGTVRLNRVPNSRIPKAQLMKQGRGSMMEK